MLWELNNRLESWPMWNRVKIFSTFFAKYFVQFLICRIWFLANSVRFGPFSRIWSDSVWFGRSWSNYDLWSDLVGFVRIRSDLVGVASKNLIVHNSNVMYISIFQVKSKQKYMRCSYWHPIATNMTWSLIPIVLVPRCCLYRPQG